MGRDLRQHLKVHVTPLHFTLPLPLQTIVHLNFFACLSPFSHFVSVRAFVCVVWCLSVLSVCIFYLLHFTVHILPDKPNDLDPTSTKRPSFSNKSPSRSLLYILLTGIGHPTETLFLPSLAIQLHSTSPHSTAARTADSDSDPPSPKRAHGPPFVLDRLQVTEREIRHTPIHSLSPLDTNSISNSFALRRANGDERVS